MYKLLFDADALIKISKAELIEAVVDNFGIAITEEVYQEAVVEGKKGLYSDADKIDNLIQKGKIKVIKGNKKKKNPKQRFGKGEVSVYKSYKKDTLIITDDLAFTLYIQKEHKKSLSSAHLIPVLVKKGKLKKAEAMHCLEKLKPLIRREIYDLVKSYIQGD